MMLTMRAIARMEDIRLLYPLAGAATAAAAAAAAVAAAAAAGRGASPSSLRTSARVQCSDLQRPAQCVLEDSRDGRLSTGRQSTKKFQLWATGMTVV